MYANDDVIGLRPLPGTTEVPGFMSAVCHYDCFTKSHLKDRFLSLERKFESDVLDEPNEHAVVCARDGEFGLVWRPADRRLELRLLGQARKLAFRSYEEWLEILGLMGGVEPATADPRFRVEYGEPSNIWERVRRECSVTITEWEFTYLAKELGLPEAYEEVTGLELHLGQALADLGLSARKSTCPLDSAEGTLQSIKLLPRTGDVQFRISVPGWRRVEISNTAMQRLTRFLEESASSVAGLEW